eukprot:scaffold108758_cov30-Tisochrysis_lutea.AAC.4
MPGRGFPWGEQTPNATRNWAAGRIIGLVAPLAHKRRLMSEQSHSPALRNGELQIGGSAK